MSKYGQQHFRPQSPETSTLLYELFRAYSEDPTMPDKLREFVRQSIDELLRSLPAEERLKGLPAEERLKGLSAEEVFQALPPERQERMRQIDRYIHEEDPALQEVLEQPIRLKVERGFKNGVASIEFHIERDGKKLLRYRAKDYRIYFAKTDEGITVHRVLHKNTFRDFLFRSKLPLSEDAQLGKAREFWKLIEQGERTRKA